MSKVIVIDISSYQANVNYQAVKDSGVEGVILRCGLTYWGKQNKGIDSCFEKHYAGFKKVGMHIGAYYYSCADSMAQADAEADFTLNLLKGKTFEYPIYFDVENNECQGKVDRTTLTNIAIRYCDTLEKAGYYVGVYASTNWFQNKLNHALLASKYTIWIADYRLFPNKELKRDLFQYSSKGKIAGINGNCDVNECYKDFPNIINTAKLNNLKPAPPPTVKYGIVITAFCGVVFTKQKADEFVKVFWDGTLKKGNYCRALPNVANWRVEMQAYNSKEDAEGRANALRILGWGVVVWCK